MIVIGLPIKTRVEKRKRRGGGKLVEWRVHLIEIEAPCLPAYNTGDDIRRFVVI
ncbi:MAG: hypothetical protein IJU03_03135 [Thermoguttaceae bacterium]|nr:hypothetical protein [Thermoguttaceae bacterium]